MANELDELTGPTMEEGRDVRVIAKQIPVKITAGTKVFDFIWWLLPPVIGGIIWGVKKAKAKAKLQQLQQKIQQYASQIDNYLEQRVQILKNCAKLVDKAVALDKDTFTKIAELRGTGRAASDEDRIALSDAIDSAGKSINIAFENYPDLKAHAEIADAMQQNSYLQREITAARSAYNDAVFAWNAAIFEWPTNQIVAAKEGYTTRIPFALDSKTREEARGEFF